jgi:putative tryptophan/tyrosine transport system substrate-binding protein
MDRRRFLLTSLAGALAAPLAAEPQPARIYRIGVLHPLSSADATPHLEAFRQGLRQLGDVEGQSVAIESRYAYAQADRLPDLAVELVRSKVDIILAVNNPAIAAAQRATTTTPIVMAGATDPVGAGFVTALARPGGRITGLSSQFGEAGGKRLQLLREAIPNVSRVAVLWDPTEPGRRAEVSVIEAAARGLKMPLQILEARSPQDIDIAFTAMTREHAGAVLAQGTSMLFGQRARIAEHAAQRHLPSMCALKEYVEAGCLMSYAVSLTDSFRRAASFVHKIRAGAAPGDLPVEQPTKFEMVINLKTAKALELTIPPSLLARADQIIE